jgi:hypothetical protein
MRLIAFMQRLAALVPRPRLHLNCFLGALTPIARLRAEFVPVGLGDEADVRLNCGSLEAEPDDGHPWSPRIRWAPLIEPVFEHLGLPARPLNLPTVEDPIEYEPPGIGQTQKGRTGVYELMVADERERDLVHRRAPASLLVAAAEAAGRPPMREDGQRLVGEVRRAAAATRRTRHVWRLTGSQPGLRSAASQPRPASVVVAGRYSAPTQPA